jgi:hypothetical protein
MSAMGKASQRVQAEARLERARETEAARALWEVLNFPRRTGDALGCLQWTDFRTGKVRRWVVEIGARRDQIVLRSPDGRRSGPHGWAWVMDHLRPKLCRGA